jgi:hypothetical protein
MDGYLSNKPENFVDDPKKLYRLRRCEAQAKKLDFVDLKAKDEGSFESSKESPPQCPRENRLPLMGEQPQPECKIGSYAPQTSPTYQSRTLRRSEGRSISRPQQSAWCNIHPSPVKKI